MSLLRLEVVTAWVGTFGHRRAVIGVACLMTAALALIEGRMYVSSARSYEQSLRQFARMRSDAERIMALRQVPHAAVGRARPNEEFLAEVEEALTHAHVDRSRWQDSIPQPLARVAGTDYVRQSTRLYFRDLPLQPLASFVWHLQRTDPALEIESVNLTQRSLQSKTFDVELSVACLIYAPLKEKPALDAGWIESRRRMDPAGERFGLRDFTKPAIVRRAPLVFGSFPLTLQSTPRTRC